MHRVLDGEAAPGDRSRLDLLLASDADASRLFEELSATWDLIGGISMVDPPAALRERILDSLPADMYRARAKRPDLASAFRTKWREVAASLGFTRQGFASRPVLAAAYVFTVGLIAGVGLYSLIDHPTAPSHVTGTFAANVEREVPVQVDGFRGTFRLRSSADALVLDVSYDAQEPVEIAFSFEAGLHLRSVARAEHVEEVMTIEDRLVRLFAAGKSEYEFIFARSGGSSAIMHIAIERDGERLHVEEIVAE